MHRLIPTTGRSCTCRPCIAGGEHGVIYRSGVNMALSCEESRWGDAAPTYAPSLYESPGRTIDETRSCEAGGYVFNKSKPIKHALVACVCSSVGSALRRLASAPLVVPGVVPGG